jgi:hypothetical protein
MNTPSGYPVKKLNLLIALNLVIVVFAVIAFWHGIPAKTQVIIREPAAPAPPESTYNTTGRIKILKLVENANPEMAAIKSRDYTVIDMDGRQLYLMTLCPEAPKLSEGWIVKVTYKVEPKGYSGCHEVKELKYLDSQP